MMGKVAEQLKDVISTSQGVDYVEMWVGPKNADEIENALKGRPTMFPYAIGPNIRDGEGVHGGIKRGYWTIEMLENWKKTQQPDKQKFPCPFCDDFIGENANALSGHIMGKHKAKNTVSTPDFEAAKTARIAQAVDKTTSD